MARRSALSTASFLLIVSFLLLDLFSATLTSSQLVVDAAPTAPAAAVAPVLAHPASPFALVDNDVHQKSLGRASAINKSVTPPAAAAAAAAVISTRQRRPRQRLQRRGHGRNPFLMQNFELSGHDGSHQDLAHALGLAVKTTTTTSSSTTKEASRSISSEKRPLVASTKAFKRQNERRKKLDKQEGLTGK